MFSFNHCNDGIFHNWNWKHCLDNSGSVWLGSCPGVFPGYYQDDLLFILSGMEKIKKKVFSG